MKFLLQKIKDNIEDVEVFNVLNNIRYSMFRVEYRVMNLEELETTTDNLSDWIPIGRIPFISLWLKKYWNIFEMKPIEVPEILREYKYLGREYRIVNKEDLVLKGNYFLKDIEQLKEFTYCGDLSKLNKDDLKSDKYVLSEVVDIVSEYRVFVSDLKIKAVQYYDGNCLIFPDSKMIQEMVLRYGFVSQRPKSYTMDIAVLKNGKTVILEVHPVAAVGTYGYDAFELLYMYQDGIDFYKGCNTNGRIIELNS